MAYYVTLGLGLIVATVFLFKRSQGANITNVVLKSLSSVAYLFTAMVAIMLNPKALNFGVLIFMGGVLGLIGDIVLDLKCIYLKDADKYLYSGFSFFLAGHVLYNIAIIMQNGLKWQYVLACVAISVVIGAITVATSKTMKIDFGKFKWIVLAYSSLLVLTSATSIVSSILTGEKSMIILAIGAVLFLLSDLVLSFTYFSKGWDKPVHIFVNHLLYYAAQFMIASSIMFIA